MIVTCLPEEPRDHPKSVIRSLPAGGCLGLPPYCQLLLTLCGAGPTDGNKGHNLPPSCPMLPNECFASFDRSCVISAYTMR